MKCEIGLMRKRSKTLSKNNRNKPISTNIAKMKNKVTMNPKKKNNRMTTRTQSFRNKKLTHREVNLEDL
jgi:hypothetical protein